MSFEPSHSELIEAGDLLGDLIKEGRRITWKENNTVSRIREMQEEASARSLAAAQRAMAKLEWRPRVSVAFLNRCVCQRCGAAHTVFAGFGTEMYRQHDEAVRVVMGPVCDPAYPRTVRYTSTLTHQCIECLDRDGFTREQCDGA